MSRYLPIAKLSICLEYNGVGRYDDCLAEEDNNKYTNMNEWLKEENKGG